MLYNINKNQSKLTLICLLLVGNLLGASSSSGGARESQDGHNARAPEKAYECLEAANLSKVPSSARVAQMPYDLFSTAERGGLLWAESTPERASQAKGKVNPSRIVSTEGVSVDKCAEANLPILSLVRGMQYGHNGVSMDHFVSPWRRLSDGNLQELLTPGGNVVAIPPYFPRTFKYQGEVNSGERVIEKALSLSLPMEEAHYSHQKLILEAARYSSRKSPPAVILRWTGIKVDASDHILDPHEVLCRLKEAGREAPILFVGRELITDVNTGTLMQTGVEIDCIDDPFMGWLSLYSRACRYVIEHPRPCLAGLVSLLANGLARLILAKRHFISAVGAGSYGDQPIGLASARSAELVGNITAFKKLLTPSATEGLDHAKLPLIVRASQLLDQASRVVSQELSQNIADWPREETERRRRMGDSMQRFQVQPCRHCQTRREQFGEAIAQCLTQ